MGRSAPRGRGAAFDPVQRFTERELLLDGDELDRQVATGEGAPERTRVFRDASRSVISRNTSPDVPFDVSLNPYRGCEHGCSYCLHPATRITMADGSTRRLADVAVGDRILGTEPGATYRTLVTTEVRDVWTTRRRAYRVTLSDGTHIVASGDHRFLTHRGWKHVTDHPPERRSRAHLTPNDVVLGVGASASVAAAPADPSDPAYRRGYLTGMIRGDGHVGTFDYGGRRRASDVQHQFRLALEDEEALARTAAYLDGFGVATWRRRFSPRTPTRAEMHAIGTHAAGAVEELRRLVALPATPTAAWRQGFVAGLFDAEGSHDGRVVRFSNTDDVLVAALEEALVHLELPYVEEPVRAGPGRPLRSVRLLGGLPTLLRLLDTVRPAIARKRRLEGRALKRAAGPLRVVGVDELHVDVDMVDLTTGTGDFIAEGIVSHNCYARPTHEYLGLSAGLDFERTLFAKPDAPALLAAELAKPAWRPQHLALSGVTDPYQPIERRLGITRGCLEVLAAHRHPVGIVTKNALVTRDLDLLVELARWGAVRVGISLTSLDEDLRRRLEPRTSTATDRLAAVRTLADAGVPVGVLVAPVIPGLNDHEIPALLEAAADHGAVGATWTLVRLPGAVEPIFLDWLERQAPLRADRVVARLREARDGALSDARFGHRMRGSGRYVTQIDQLFTVQRRRVGLERDWPALDTRHFRVPGQVVQASLFDAPAAGGAQADG